jgi:hypothetical protein
MVRYEGHGDPNPKVLELPEETWLHILNYLSVPDLAQAAQVCHYWNCLTNDDFIWKSRLMGPSSNKIPFKKSYERFVLKLREQKRARAHIPKGRAIGRQNAAMKPFFHYEQILEMWGIQ